MPPAKRKVIQIVVVPLNSVRTIENVHDTKDHAEETAMVALLDDGSLWRCVMEFGEAYDAPTWVAMIGPD